MTSGMTVGSCMTHISRMHGNVKALQSVSNLTKCAETATLELMSPSCIYVCLMLK